MLYGLSKPLDSQKIELLQVCLEAILRKAS